MPLFRLGRPGLQRSVSAADAIAPMRGPAQPGCRSLARPSAAHGRDRLPPPAARLPADAGARPAGRRRRARPRSGWAERRVRPVRAARLQDPRRIVGRRANASGDSPEWTRWSRPAPAITVVRSRMSPGSGGWRCRIFLPGRSAPARRDAIAGEGAEVVIVDGTYEEAVARAGEAAADARVVEVADTGSGPTAEWVIDGYATLFDEALGQFAATPDRRPGRRGLAGRRRCPGGSRGRASRWSASSRTRPPA